MKQNRVIQLHPVLLLFLFLSYFLGMFVELICFFIIITLHELGHFIAAKYFKWNISKLMIWPFGGVMETEDFFNRPSREELIVVLAGPFQHLWIYVVIIMFDYFSLLNLYLDQLLWMNTIILLFNLIPILPLDGGRVVFVGLTHFMAFNQAITFMVLISIIVIVTFQIMFLLVGWTSIHLTFLSVFLLFDNWLMWKNKHILLIKHLLARYLKASQQDQSIEVLTASSETPVTDLVKHFKKNHFHYVYLDEMHRPLSETECLHALFTQNQHPLKLAHVK